MRTVVGVLAEAWGEVRVHRARVVLSLVGVFLAVFAMTIITAAGEMARTAITEQAEAQGGRSTTLQLAAYSTTGSADPAAVTRLYSGLVQRFGVDWSSTVLQTSGSPLGAHASTEPLGFDPNSQPANAYVVQPDWAVIHRLQMVSGRFLVDGDAARLVPAVVLNQKATEVLGTTGRATPYGVRLTPLTSAVVVGTVQRDEYGPEVISLPTGPSWLPAAATTNSTPTLEMWVPTEHADAIRGAVDRAVKAQGYDGPAQALGDDESLQKVVTVAGWGIRGISLFALALGALGVLNVGVVTVRQRVREIGVRRALGASSARVFAGIMLESVVATALAAVAAIAVAVAVVVNLPLETLARDAGISEVPPFPWQAAVEAFVAATVVGALVGLVPAVIAVHAKVIDAIRY